MLKEKSKKAWEIWKTVVYLQKISCTSAKNARGNKKQKPMVETNNRRFLGAEAKQQRRHRCRVRANKSQAIC